MSHEDNLTNMIVDVLEAAHTDSLSDNDQIAIVGRARKHMIESALYWLDSEEKRGDDLGNIVAAMAYYSGGVVAKIAVCVRDSNPQICTFPSNSKLVEIFTSALNEESIAAIRLISEKNK